MSQALTIKRELTVAGREVTILEKETPYAKVTVLTQNEMLTVVSSRMYYVSKVLDVEISNEELKKVSPFLSYILRNYVGR